MLDRVENQSEAMAMQSPQLRPRIGADSFRALAERLKKPATVVPQIIPPAAPAQIEVVPVEIQPQIQAEAIAYEPVAIEMLVEPTVVHEQQRVEQELITQSAPLWNSHTAEEPAASREPAFRHMEWSSSASQQAVVDEIHTAPPETELFIAPEEVVEQIVPPPIVETFAAETAPPPIAIAEPRISPLQRVLAAEPTAPHAMARALPEILAAPLPLAPAVPVDPASLEINIEPPTMEEVTERLKEDAVNRLLQLDIENIWRQVLAKPTLEERSDYLREAAEMQAAEDSEAALPSLAVPEEFDLSRIEKANAIPPIAEIEPSEETELAITYSEAEPASDSLNAEQQETAELARSLLDMMASGASSGLPQERALAADTLLRLLPKLALKPLIFLAQRLSMMDNPPPLLIAKLIRDDRLQVSGPLLEDCAHIADQDLIMVVDEEHSGKRRMIARRRHLSRAVCDKLITTKDPSVLLTMVRNANAEISNDGFAELTVLAAELPDLMAPLSTRADLSAPNAFELFWPAPAQLRRYLLNRFLTDSETLTKILKITLSSTLGEVVKEKGSSSNGELTEMLQLACAGSVETASAKLANVLGLDAATVHRILLDREGEAIIVMLKTLGFPRSILGDLLPGLKRGDIPLLSAERDVTELQTLFDTLSSNKARILITYWDWAVRKAGPYAPVH